MPADDHLIPSLRNVYADYIRHSDTGFLYHPSCLACPDPTCALDLPSWFRPPAIRMSKLPELTPGIMRLRIIILILFVAVVLLLVLFLSFLFSEIARDCATPFEF